MKIQCKRCQQASNSAPLLSSPNSFCLIVTLPLAVPFRHRSLTSSSSWVWPCARSPAFPGPWCCDVAFLQRHLPLVTERGWQERHPVSVWPHPTRTTWHHRDQWDWHWSGETIIFAGTIEDRATLVFCMSQVSPHKQKLPWRAEDKSN